MNDSTLSASRLALVLGGTGFIGSQLCAALRRAGWRVRAFGRRLPGEGGAAAVECDEFVQGDFAFREKVAQAVDGADTVFHLVSTTVPGTSAINPFYDVQTNIIPSIQLLELCVARKIRRVVFSSSGGTVYGPAQYLPIDEKHPTNPVSPYGVSKLAIEKYLGVYAATRGLGYAVLRFGNVYGPGHRARTGQGLVTALIERGLAGEPIEIWGDGTVARDYLYVDDAARALVAASAYVGVQRAFNAATGIGTSVNDLLISIERTIGRRLEVRRTPGRAFDVPANVLDASLAARELDWRPQVSLEDGLRRTANWLSEVIAR